MQNLNKLSVLGHLLLQLCRKAEEVQSKQKSREKKGDAAVEVNTQET